MTNEPGFYVVTRKDEMFKRDCLLWIFKQKGQLYYQEGNGFPVPLNKEHEYDLDQYTFVKKLGISRKEMEFSSSKITITTQYGNHTFEFQVRNLIRLYDLLVILLPGLGRSLLLSHLIRKLDNLYKKPKLKR